jgi:poly(hydroxyalkanoate) depolymerase family esterase
VKCRLTLASPYRQLHASAACFPQILLKPFQLIIPASLFRVRSLIECGAVRFDLGHDRLILMPALLKSAEEQTFLVAYPAQARSANISKCWNWFKEGEQRRDRGEPSLIAGITRQIMRDFPIDSGRVYVAGLSAGGAAAAILGITYPDLYAGIGVHSGLACGAARDMPSAFAAMRLGGTAPTVTRRGSESIVPTIVFHGDSDRTVNSVNSDQVISQSRAATDLTTEVSHGTAPGGMSYTRTIQMNGTGRILLEQWMLHGAGHAWSGGSTAGSYTDPRGPDASREMVRFFLQQPTTAAGSSG